MAETDVMPPLAMDEETRRQKLASNPPAIPPAYASPLSLAPQPRSQPPSPLMPPASPAPAQPPASPTAGQPAIPPIPMNRMSAGAVGEGDLSAFPKGHMPPAQAAAPSVGPAQQKLNDLQAQGEPKLPWWKRALDIAGSISPIGREIEANIPGSPQNYSARLNQAAVRAAGEQGLAKGKQELETGASKAQFETPEKRRAYLESHQDEFGDVSDFEKNDFILSGKTPQREPEPGKTPEETTLHDLMTGENGQPRINPETKKPYSYLEAYGATKAAGQAAKPPKAAEEQIREQINTEMAKPQPDQKLVGQLQNRLKTMNPLAEDRLKDAENRTAEAQRPKDQAEAALDVAAKSIAGGDLTAFKDIASMRGEDRLRLYDKIKAIDPKFSTSALDRKIKMMDSFTNGKDSLQLQSFGTFLEHAGEASNVLDSMYNSRSTTPVFNKSLNWYAKNLSGDPGYQQLVTSLEPVRKEFEGFLLGGHALYGDDRKNAELILSNESSPSQINAALKQMGHTVKARYNEMGQRFKTNMGQELQDVIPISDAALAGAKKIGVDVGGGGGKLPDGAIAGTLNGKHGYALNGQFHAE